MKTYDIWKMIDEDPEKMKEKKFKLFSAKRIGDIMGIHINGIAVVGENAYYPGLFSKDGYPIRGLTGFEEWEEVKETVTWEEAFKAGLEGKKIKPKGQTLTFPDYETLDYVIPYLAERPSYYKKIMLDEWYIED